MRIQPSHPFLQVGHTIAVGIEGVVGQNRVKAPKNLPPIGHEVGVGIDRGAADGMSDTPVGGFIAVTVRGGAP